MPIAEKKVYPSVLGAGGVRSRVGALSPGQIGRAGPAPPGLSRFWQLNTFPIQELTPVAAAGRTTKNTRAWPLGSNIGMGWRT